MTISSVAGKSADAFRTISEVAESLRVPQHVLRFWETRFTQIKPLKRAGGRRFYRPEDIELLDAIRQLLYGEGYTIKGVQRILREQGPRAVAALARADGGPIDPPGFETAGTIDDEDGEPPAEGSDEGPPAHAAYAPVRPRVEMSGDSLEPPPGPGPMPWDDPAPEAARTGDEPPADDAILADLRAVLAEIEVCRRLLDDGRC